MTAAVPAPHAVAQVRIGQPPFAYRVEAPDSWTRLETAPNTWQRSVQRVLDPPERTRRLPAALRRGAAALLEDAVSVAQQTGVVLCLTKLAVDERGRQFCGTLSLAWYDSTPVAADLAFARLVAGGNTRPGVELEEFDTPLSRAVLRCDRVVAPADLDLLLPLGRSHTVQAFVPVPDTHWTALLSGTVGDPHHLELLTKLVRWMAGSLQPDLPATPPPTTTRHTTTGHAAAPAPAPQRLTTSTGMGKGFRTTRINQST